MGLVAPRHGQSSWTRDQTRVPCTGRRIRIHCTAREILLLLLMPLFFFLVAQIWFRGKRSEVSTSSMMTRQQAQRGVSRGALGGGGDGRRGNPTWEGVLLAVLGLWRFYRAQGLHQAGDWQAGAWASCAPSPLASLPPSADTGGAVRTSRQAGGLGEWGLVCSMEVVTVQAGRTPRLSQASQAEVGLPHRFPPPHR